MTSKSALEPTFEDLYDFTGEITLAHFPMHPINLFVDSVRSPLDVYGDDFGPWRVARSVEAAEAILALGRVRTLSIGDNLELLYWIKEHNHWHSIERIEFHSQDFTVANEGRSILQKHKQVT